METKGQIINIKDLSTKLSRVALVVSDVDGVLTKGEIAYDNHGNEIKIFNVKDGLGFKLLQYAGIHVAVITGRSSEAVQKRFKELNVEDVFQGVRDKDKTLKQLIEKHNITSEQVLYLGDDWNDLPAFAKAGVKACPADAHDSIIEICDIVTERRGGEGSFRELVDMILKAQNKWNDLINGFRDVN